MASIFLAFYTQLCNGWFSGSVCILVKDCSILRSSRSPAGGSTVSYSRAAVGVVLKHPVIALIASRWVFVSSVI